jgi:glucose-6-phosphate dehydrogenase assembly protein OpcA
VAQALNGLGIHTMDNLFEALPGVDTPVGKVVSTLADIWEMNREEAANAPSAFRASQMNLVLHFGLGTSAEEGHGCFQQALGFAKRHPCRILVLCPASEAGEVQVRAKVFAECHIGRSRQEMICCEAIILSYAKESRSFLENQVSTLVESDLPTYYWPHHFFLGRKIQEYLFFVNAAHRVIVDTAVDGEELLTSNWPRPEAVRDLAHARILPVRQVLGQFLSGFAVEAIVGGLSEVIVTRCAGRQPEARALLRWLEGRLQACAVAAGAPGLEIGLSETACPADQQDVLGIEFRYSNERSLKWQADLRGGHSEARANLGGTPVELRGSISLLGPEAALGEAVFF